MRFPLRYTVTAFLAGAAIMVVEISAARAIAPHFGTSIVVWTNVIGVVLVALAIGYGLGGRLAERSPDDRVLAALLCTAGILSVIPAFATRGLAESLLADMLQLPNGFLIVLAGSFAAVVLLFALPLMLLGAVSPMLVKLACHERNDVGAVAGRLSAIATAGSLAGTFLPTLVLLPLLGTRRTMLLAAAVLFALGAVIATRRRMGVVAGALVLVLAFISEPPLPWLFGGTTIAQRDSRYQLIRVVDHETITGRRARMLVFNEGFGVQSRAIFDPADARGYAPIAAAMLALTDVPTPRVLILGNAGGSIAHLAQQWFAPRAPALTGVEIDPEVTALAAATFPAPSVPYPVAHMDSRVFLRTTIAQYDAIVADAYTNQLTIPAHLATVEYFTLLRERLADGGIAVVNVNAPSEDSRVLRALTATVAAAFPHAVVGKAGATWNFLIVASAQPVLPRLTALRVLDVPDAAAEDIARFLATVRAVEEDGVAHVLTDDRAPLELLMDREIFDALRRVRSGADAMTEDAPTI